MKFYVWIVSIIIIFAVAIAVISNKTENLPDKNPNLSEEVVKKVEIMKINGKEFEIEILDENNERTKGLSGRQSLEKNKIMLFVFENPGYYGIWMKEMLFGIDIAWLDQNKKIVHIEKNVSPETFPKIFYPQSESLFVLEVNAGFFDSENIQKGDIAEF